MLIFAGVLLSADSFPGDFPTFYYTVPAYWIASLTAGEWPSWIPYAGMGMPLGAIPQSGILYPPLWIFPILHLPFTLKAASILQVFHVWAGGVGTYALARRLFGSSQVAFVAGSAYLMYGGFYVNAQHADVVRGFVLLPWLFWALWIPTNRLRERKIPLWVSCSGMSSTNVAVPAITLLLVTGAYPGHVEALTATIPLFIGLQLLRNARDGQPIRSAALDHLLLLVLLGLGCALASAFVFPLAATWDEVTRTSGGVLSASSLIYLHVHDLYGLVLSSNVVRPDLHRDIGMQLPLVLFPFVLFIRRRTAWQLLPFVGVAILALVMALDVLTNVSRLVINLVPLLGYSRFPAGDYRTFFALTVLLALTGGLRDVLTRPESARRLSVRYLVGLGVLGLIVAPALLFAPALPPNIMAEAASVVARQAAPAAVLALVLFARRARILRMALPLAVGALCVASSLPVLWDMRDDWQVQDAERWMLNDANMKLWDGDTWRVDQVFQQSLTTRPARNAKWKYPNEVSWNAYLNGQFLLRDDDGAILRARHVVERDAELNRFMTDESRLIAVPCTFGVCQGESDVHIQLASAISLTPPDFTWQPAMYGRSVVRYKVVLPEPSLVIENEIYARGWKATLEDGGSVRAMRVNNALRGWQLPAGEHQLELSFETPLLAAGVIASLLAALVYLGVLVTAARRWLLLSPTHKP